LEAGEFLASGLTFPDGEGLPAEAADGGDAAAAAGVHVPEAAVDEDDFFEAREDEVRRAGEGSDMESVAEAEGVDEAADGPKR
jgi:hypothetical protein